MNIYSASRRPYEYGQADPRVCSECGKTYSTSQRVDIHQRECRGGRSSLSELLHETKLFWETRKKRQREESIEQASASTQAGALPYDLVRAPSPPTSAYLAYSMLILL